MQVRNARRHLAGAVAGAAVPALLAAGSWWLGGDLLVGLAAAGIPVGLGVGWWIGPRAAAPGRAISSTLLATAAGVTLAVVAACVIGLVDLVTDGGDPSRLLGIVLFVPYVIAYGLVLGLPVAAPVAAACTALVRLAAARPRIGWAALAMIAGLALALGGAAVRLGPAIEARVGADLRRAGLPPIALAFATTEVRWTVANCATWLYTVSVADRPLVGEPRETSWPAEPGLSSGTRTVAPGWMLRLAADPDAPIPPGYLGPNGVLLDVPGELVELRLEISPNGAWSYALDVDGERRTNAVPQCALPG